MTKYAIRLKSSSGLAFSVSCFPHRLTFRTAPYRSPKFHVTRPGTRTVLKPRQRLHATRETPEESEEHAFYRRLQSYRDRDDVGHRHQNGLEDDESVDWVDESTLIAMLQDKYVSILILRASRSCWTRRAPQRFARGRRLRRSGTLGPLERRDGRL